MLIIVRDQQDAAGVSAQLGVIEVLRAVTSPMRTLIENTPWVEVRWANPRYL